MAEAVLREDFTLGVTVLMEVEWVLRSVYRWPRARIVTGLRLLLDMPTLIHAPALANWAVDRYAAGADFADMMHLCAAGGADIFVTFDRRIAGFAGAESPVSVETLG